MRRTGCRNRIYNGAEDGYTRSKGTGHRVLFFLLFLYYCDTVDRISLSVQQGDFEALYEALEGNPVTIRFLDPPLHEFVPTEEEDIKKLADAQGKTVDQIKAIIASLHEFNPMMGHRGCRLAVTYPEIAEMQTKAIIKAAINVKKKHPDWTVKPEIMIPLVGDVKELKFVKKVVVETADAEIAAAGSDLSYEVGTMIEIPRSCSELPTTSQRKLTSSASVQTT